MKLTPRTLAGLAYRHGLNRNDSAIAAAVALAESGGNTLAKNPVPPDDSYGLWQINMLDRDGLMMGTARRKAWGLQANEQLYDAATNARAMVSVLAGQGWSRGWTTYSRGSYARHLPATTKEAASLMAGTADDVIAVALASVGMREDPPESNICQATLELDATFPPVPLAAGGTHTRSKTAWCGSWILWVLWQAGYPVEPDGSITVNGVTIRLFFTPHDLSGFRAAGALLPPTARPPVGAAVFYKWPGVSSFACDHVGLVVAVAEDGTPITVEGNVGPNTDRVTSYGPGMEYPARQRNIVGYGVIPYPVELPPNPATPGDLMYRYVTVPGANAAFLGLFDAEGYCALLHWVTDAETVRRWQNKAPISLTFEQVRSMWVDRLPVGDGAHTWLESEFAGVGAPQGPPGLPGAPGEPGAPGGPGAPGVSPDPDAVAELAVAKIKERL